MAALVYAPSSHHYYAFPLVVQWRSLFDALAFYFPRLHFGRLEGGPEPAGFTSELASPQPQHWRNLHREYQPGELSQWQAYLEFLETLNYQDETDLKAAIRGRLEPMLPQQVNREMLWSLAHQLEQMLSEKAAELERLARQQEELNRVLAADLGEEELAPLDATLNPSLSGGLPDLPLARVRWHFWREVLAPHLVTPWTAVVLEPLAAESSPRYLWQAAQESGGELWQAGFSLPAWKPEPGGEVADMLALELGVAFGKMLSEVLQTLRDRPEEVEAGREKLASLVEEGLWPASGLSRTQAIYLEIFGWRRPAPENYLTSEPMVFVSPAGSGEQLR